MVFPATSFLAWKVVFATRHASSVLVALWATPQGTTDLPDTYNLINLMYPLYLKPGKYITLTNELTLFLVDRAEWDHTLFVKYVDVCRKGPGEDHPFTVGMGYYLNICIGKTLRAVNSRDIHNNVTNDMHIDTQAIIVC